MSVALKASTAPNGTNGTVTVPIPTKTIPAPSSDAKSLEIPDNHFQIFQKSLLEHEFEHEDAFVSAHLSRLQYGIYQDDRMDMYGRPTKSINVTFVAITFAFHPMHSAEKRFKRAQISIQALKHLANLPKRPMMSPSESSSSLHKLLTVVFLLRILPGNSRWVSKPIHL